MQLKRPIDSGQPLDSINGLKYLWKIRTIVGTNRSATFKSTKLPLLYYMYSAVLNFLAGICFPASLLTNLYFINSWQDLVANLSLSFSIAIATCKHFAVLVNHKSLVKSHKYLKLLDLRSNSHSRDRRYILKGSHYCHLYSLAYIGMYLICTAGFSYIGWTHNQLIYNAWFPKLFTDERKNYVTAFMFQYVSQTYMVFQNGFNDAYPLCYLTLMIAHSESLAKRIERIGRAERKPLSIVENIRELRLCVRDHTNLLSYFACICPVISTTLFMQFLITAFVLCLTAINLIAFNLDLTQQFFAFFYLGVVLVQIYPCCWMVSVLMEKSDYLTTAMYNCNWMDQNQEFRKMLIIFMQRSQKTNKLLAGNIAPVNLQTFLAIIRFSFSMFTVLIKM